MIANFNYTIGRQTKNYLFRFEAEIRQFAVVRRGRPGAAVRLRGDRLHGRQDQPAEDSGRPCQVPAEVPGREEVPEGAVLPRARHRLPVHRVPAGALAAHLQGDLRHQPQQQEGDRQVLQDHRPGAHNHRPLDEPIWFDPAIFGTFK